MAEEHPPRARLRTRFILVACIMLLPLLALGGVAFFSHERLKLHFDDVVEEAIEEKEPVIHLQVLVQSVGTPLHRFLLYGEEEDRILYQQLAGQIDALFGSLASAPFALDAEREYLAAAHQHWRELTPLAARLLADPIAGSETSLQLLRRLEGDLLVIAAELDAIHDISDSEIEAKRRAVEEVNRESMLLIAAVLLAGLATAIGSWALLARLVLRPVEDLGRGVRQFAEGNLDYRISGGGKDELGTLVTAFNGMAEKLERQQAALLRLSTRDPLTGLLNHREFFCQLREELIRARRYGHPLVLLMIDLDHFKQVNDNFGHPNGDRVLRTMAVVLRRQLRTSDLIGRYGGEEFAVVLPETGGQEAFDLAVRIRRALAAQRFDFNGEKGIQVTASFGVAAYPADADTEAKLLSCADAALYAAKHAGRDRVCWRSLTDGPGNSELSS